MSRKIRRRLEALEGRTASSWGEFLDGVPSSEIERLERIFAGLPSPSKEAEFCAGFGELAAGDRDFVAAICERKEAA